MLGTGLQFGQVRSEDLLCIPVKARKSQKQKPKRQLQKAEENDKLHSNNKDSDPANDSNSNISKDILVPKDAASAVVTEPPSRTLVSNLECFLESTTPSVPAQYLSKTRMRGWRTCDVEFQPYFTLGDLWDSFKEWSAYGVGVPLVLEGRNRVVQYYVPYLSGIQLYGESTANSSPKSRQAAEVGDSYYYRDSSSDGSSDYEFEKNLKFPRELLDCHFASDNPFRIGSLSTSDEHSATQDGFSSDDGEAVNSQGLLLFEFFEQDIPYCREPLADKITDLACHYPGLNTLRSCDLLPVSWVSVAWYPIYRIPTGSTLKDLDACFLTYHSLSTPMCAGNGNNQPHIVNTPSEIDDIPRISFPVFGMASYKFKSSMWTRNGASELQLESSLTKAADSWLRLLQVNHPDFQFFASHGMHQR